MLQPTHWKAIKMGVLEGLKGMAGAAWRRINAAGLILMYHRVGEVCVVPWGVTVSPGHFAEHLDVLHQHGQPLPLAQVVAALQNRRLPRKTLVVTFDDGYADNLYNARPLLERYDVPATVFLTTGYIGSGREFWWDELERSLLGPEVLPEALSLTAAGRTWEWVLGEARHYRADTRESDRQWRATRHGAPSRRYELYREVHRVLLPLGGDERRGVLDELHAWAGVPMGVRESHRCLSPDEVVALTQGELIAVGSHTVTHPPLPELPVAAQREEIRQSKHELEQLLGHPVTSFAYAYGHQAAETAALLHAEGFASACSVQAGLLSRQSDLFSLPRIKVEDWEGEKLDRVLSDWFKR